MQRIHYHGRKVGLEDSKVEAERNVDGVKNEDGSFNTSFCGHLELLWWSMSPRRLWLKEGKHVIWKIN